MTGAMTDIKGGCHCGKVNYTISFPTASLPRKAWICHCNSCRKAQGSIALFHTAIPAPDSTLASSLSVYQSSKNANRYFCPTCGCRPFERDDTEEGPNWCLSTGAVQREDFQLFQFANHMFIEDTKDGGASDWLVSSDGKPLKRWALDIDQSQELPLDWSSLERQPTKGDKLRARCHCGGVEFYISRPLFDSPEFKKDFPNFQLPDNVPRGKEHWFIAKDKQKWIAGFCSCRDCRLVNGMEVMSWTYVPTSLITLADGSPHRLEFGTLKCYKSSSNVTRRFCGRCGATAFYGTTDRPNVVDVAVGLLESDAGAKAEDWLEWRKDTISFRSGARDPKLVEEIQHGCQTWQQRRDPK